MVMKSYNNMMAEPYITNIIASVFLTWLWAFLAERLEEPLSTCPSTWEAEAVGSKVQG